ncbi:MAG: alpha/beta hydrolase [Alphaproteobacteria bacterium]|nr:alpha/beta hydrolase [Alphaproteobacteria bacterium]
MPFPLLPHAFFDLGDGGKLRYARFEPASAPCGTILIVPGRREFIEKKYAELGDRLRGRGYRLIIVEPRGQGLSSRFLSGAQRQRDHIGDFKMHLDDLRAFFAAVVLPDLAAPLIFHGHSMGAHLILRWLAEDRPAQAKAAFLTAPMLALSSLPAHALAHGVSWLSVHVLGHATEYAPMQHDFDARDCTFEDNVLTQDPERFPIIENYFKAHPDLTVGGVTWGWLLASMYSMHIAHRHGYLANIDIPVLALVGDRDKVTPVKETGPYLNEIPRVRTHIIANARHDLMNEADAARNEVWTQVEEFLSSVLTAR